MFHKRLAGPLISLGVLAVAGGLLAGDTAAAPTQNAGSGSVLVDQSFASTATASAFTTVCGGAWTSGSYVYTLADAVTSSGCIGSPNLTVDNTPLTGDWQLAVRMSALPTLPGRDGFSVVFGYHDASDYSYANFSQDPASGSNGVFQVAGGTITELASFAHLSPALVTRRNYDITLTTTGTTVRVAEGGVMFALVSAAQLGGSSRVGLGSQGSDVTARQLTVTGVAPVDPVAGTSAPSSSGSGRPAPSTSPHSSPNATVTPDPTATPKPTSTPTPKSTPTPTPKPTPAPTAPPVSGACSPGSFPVAYFGPAFTGPASRTFSEQFMSDDGSYVQACYPAGSSSPSSGAPGGAQAKLSIASGPTTDVTLTYQIRFPVGFQWVKGGKLPGLCGGQCWTGSDNGAGGWAARFMWRPGGAGEVLLSDATTTGYGTDLGIGDWTFLADGQWHTLTEHVTMNTPGQPNGSIVVTYAGVQVADFTGITFRATGDTDEIDSLMFSTFFGGHDSSWAPSATMAIDFAGFTLG
jgi:hypothetical protein